jgi:hypothetical protein
MDMDGYDEMAILHKTKTKKNCGVIKEHPSLRYSRSHSTTHAENSGASIR